MISPAKCKNSTRANLPAPPPPLAPPLPAAATKIRKRIKRIRENSSTISHLFVVNSRSSSEARRGGRGSALMAVVQWHKMPIRISSSQSVGPCAGIADALGAVCPLPSLRQRRPFLFLASSPSLWLDFSQTQIVYRLQGTLLTLRPGPGRSRVRLGLSIFMFDLLLLLAYPVHSWRGVQQT